MVCKPCDLNNESDPQAALQAIIDRPGPALIHVRIDAQQKKCIRWYRRVRPILRWWGNKPCKKQHDNVILELTVRNHPGVMTHVCGLFARRAFNVEGILCLPIQGSEHSRIWLLVNDDQRLGQMISQIEKLEDVTNVARNQSDPTMFNKIAVFFE